jgi:signal transduction histidine kinase
VARLAGGSAAREYRLPDLRADVDASFQDDIDAIGRIASVPTILDVVCRVTGMRFAAVARVTSDRWIACQVLDQIEFGLVPGGELEVQTTICHEIRQSGEAVVIDHVAEDTAFCGHPTPAKYGFQSYISMPIVLKDGSFFGTLCAIDPKPAKLRNPETVGMFKLFAELIATQLDAQSRLATAEASLVDAQHVSDLRDQFIAVLSHDLRNSVAAIAAGARLLKRDKLDDKAAGIVTMIQGSVGRITDLLNNVLDFARVRLGDGIPIARTATEPLKPALDVVASELRTAHPDRQIHVDLAFDDPIDADTQRLGQLFSNLLANAVSHGAADHPVRVVATAADGTFRLSVANGGMPIDPGDQERLFRPFVRGRADGSKQGLGLGLFIAAEIARAHGGTLSVASSETETVFAFTMPLAGR